MDRTRIRVGVTPKGARGTVLIFPGRTEYVEKYGPTACALHDAGLGSVVIDWRGQGLADRACSDPMLGHVERFANFQQDVTAVVTMAMRMELPRPWYMLAHSMGGAIGLRALINGIEVDAAAFSAPMWGLTMSAPLRPVARVLPAIARAVSRHIEAVPGVGRNSYTLAADPADNLLTSHAETFIWFREHLRAHPELGLGPPTLSWLGEALGECSALMKAPPPDIPSTLFLGSNERIVHPNRIRQMAARWPGSRLELIEGGEHEVLMERPEMLEQVIGGTLELFLGQKPG